MNQQNAGPTIHRHEDGGYVWTECPEHGPNVKVDEDGCCMGCGVDAVRYGRAPGNEPVSMAQFAESIRAWFAHQPGGIRHGGNLHSASTVDFRSGYRSGLQDAEAAVLHRLTTGAMMLEKLKMYRLTYDGASYTAPTMDAIAAELQDAEVGHEYTINVVEMTQAEYDALPEFEGF